ncbi:MAG: phosphotransferase family protein [Halobacteriales archaeon]
MTERELEGAFDAEPLRAAGAVALDSIEAAPVSIEPINRGNRKQTAIARFGTRAPVVVQVCPERSWLQTEAAVLRAIRDRTTVPVPPVLTAGTHDGIAYLLTAYVAGDDLHGVFTSLDRATRRTLVRWFGTALANLHEAFVFDAYGRLVCSDNTLVAQHHHWGEWFQAYGRQAIDRLPGAFDGLRDELTALFESAPDTDPTARLFPWDFRPGNALIADGEITAVLDWEAPLAAAPALSVAKAEYLIADWYVADPEPLRDAFMTGYTAVRAYPSIEPAHRVAAIAESAVDSAGRVTNPRYPPVDRADAVAFHRTALKDVLDTA